MGNRIESETASLNESNRQLRLKAKELFKQNNVSGFCNTGFFYCMFAPCGAGDVFKLILLILLFCGCVPAIVCVALSYTIYQTGVHTLTYVVISQAIVIAEFIIYFIVFNLAKVKNLEIVNEGRRIRNKVRANNKQIRIIRNSITRDKDESVYNLGKYDEKLSELEAEREDISNRKLEAIKVFENDTKQVITDEITGRRQPKIDALKADLKQLEEKINAMESQLADMQSHLTDSYVTFLGKDLLTEEKLSDLISIMEEGTASTVSGAIEVYKGES